MKRLKYGVLALELAGMCFASSSYAQQPSSKAGVNKVAASSANSANPDYRAVLNKYCVVCHNEKAQMGGLMLDKADLSKIPEASRHLGKS